MQQHDPSPDTMRGRLEDPAVRQTLQQRWEFIHKELATTIGKAAELVGVPEAKLRYWESVGLLAPSRSNQLSQATDRSRQRYYGMDQLAQAVVIKELEKEHSLAEIKDFIKREAQFIKQLTAEPSTREPEAVQDERFSVVQGIRSAEDALLWEFLLPRFLYLSLSLLFGRAFTGNGGIYLPVREQDTLLEPRTVTRSADLPGLGEGLLGWREPNHAFFAAPFKAPPPELLGNYEVIPLAGLLPAGSDALPIGAHLVLGPQFAALLRQAGTSKKGSAEARRVAGRLLKFLQDQHLHWRAALYTPKSTLLFDSPTLTTPALGEPLLNEVAELIVALGGTDKETKQPLWRFCCILLPEDLLKPLMERSLIIKGQNKASPHQVGETKLVPSKQRPNEGPGLSILAYQSGASIYRSHITPKDPSLAWRDQEEPIGSAIAIPIEGEYGKALGVLYIVSAAYDAFPVESQQLLRVLGRVVGELVSSARGRSLTTDDLPDLLETPEIVDHILKGFRTINAFRDDLYDLFQRAMQEKEPPFQYLSLIAVDIDDLSRIAVRYGDQAALRNLVDAVGQRIQDNAPFLFRKEISLYRAYVDRFYLLLKDMSADQAAVAAEELKHALGEPYQVDAPRVSLKQAIYAQNRIEFQITTRLGVTGYSYEDIRAFTSVEKRWVAIDLLERRLYDALDLGRGRGGVVVRL